MKKLGEITLDKPLVFVTSGQSVFEAVKKMADNNVGAVAVLDDTGCLKGIFSERDVIKRCLVNNLDIGSVKVNDVMTTHVIVMEASDTYNECLSIMKQENIRHMPVRDGEKLIGIVSIRDLMQTEVVEKEQEIEMLNSYIRYNIGP